MARSLGLPQRIVFGFVKALDFTAVEPLISDLQPRAEGFGRSQVLDSAPDGLSSRCEAFVVLAAVLGALRQEEFGRGADRKTCALAKPLFVLKLFQCHRSERSGIAHATLRKLDDLPGNETCCGRQLYVGDRTQVWRHGHTGFLWATYGIDGGTTEAVRASLLCAPSGPPANAPGPPLGIANGRDAGTCRGGGPLGGLLCAVAG